MLSGTPASADQQRTKKGGSNKILRKAQDASSAGGGQVAAAATPSAVTGGYDGFPTLLSQKELTFVVSPPEITFNKYEPFQTYECPLVFKNQTKTVRSVKLLAPHSRYFSISEPRTSGSTLKVAAGLSVAYTVSFRPEEDSDYECDLVAVTETERFIVQVRAYASRGRLDLPTSFTFASPVVKYKTEKVVLLRNVGIKPTAWAMDVPHPWSVTPSQGQLAPGDNLQMCLCFEPPKCIKYAGDMRVTYSNGDMTVVPLAGEARDVAVSLSQSVLQLEATFISLERQGAVTLINNSDVTVRFQWKAHAALDEETAEKHRLAARLQQRVDTERDIIVSSLKTTTSTESLSGSKRTLRGLDRKGRSKMQSLEEGSLLFEHEYFTIEPLCGEVPARSQRDIVVTFNPQLATSCEVGAYLDVVGRAERLPLQLKGQGIGPKCHFSYDALDLGDVFISSIHRYELMLQNRGSIEARFSLNQTASLFSKNFKFKPSHGTVPPGGSLVIAIEFCSDMIGILNESFFFHIQGSRSDLGIHFKGRVIGPTFHFDTDEIDFGSVSFNFMHRRTFTLINTSEIPMRYRLRVPEDNGIDKEFEMLPSSGLILPHGRQKITLDFLSNTVQEYNAHLVVDVDEVGENLHSLPLKASCIVPQLTVLQEALDFGKGGVCFVGHPYEVTIEIRNDSALSSKYEVGLPPQDDPIRRKLDIDVVNKKGIVPAGSIYGVKLRLVAKLVGGVHLPIYIRVLGSEKRIPVSVSAKVTGPVVSIDHTTLDFGKANVLTEHCKNIELVNESPIPAVFTCRLLNKCPMAFSLKNNETVIPPKTTYSLPVYCFLDDTTKFLEELVITIANSKDINVTLVAIGTGTTLVPSISLEHDVDFGNVFTTAPVKKSFTLYNKGKRQLQITWGNDRAKPKDGEAPFTFTISPERATIAGKSEQEFTFEGMNDRAGRATEKFICKLTKTHKMVFRPTVVGLFVTPLVDLSDKALNFAHTWEAGMLDASEVHSKPLTIRNASPMTLGMSLRAGAPFTIDQTEYTLRPSESCTVLAELNAGYRSDRISHKLKTKLSISYKDHPQRDTIDLLADIAYPNLSLLSSGHPVVTSAPEKYVMDFGCIMHESEKRMYLVVANNSKVNATYEWVFENVDPRQITPGTGNPPKQDKDAKLSGGGTAGKDGVLGCSAFDVLPIRGFLRPGESEKVEFVYYSMSARKARTNAVLVVEGGPEYPISLQGEASSMHFRFDRSVLDFSNVAYDRHEERELFLTNNGKVVFSYKVDLSQFPRPGVLEVTPSSGTIKGGEKLRLLVRLYPKVPDRIDGFFQVHVAHFEPHSIYVTGMGLYPSIALQGPSVSRVRPPEAPGLLAEARKLLACDNRRYFLRSNGGGGQAKRGEESSKVVADLDEEIERLYFSKVLSGEVQPLLPPGAAQPAAAAAKKASETPIAQDTSAAEQQGDAAADTLGAAEAADDAASKVDRDAQSPEAAGPDTQLLTPHAAVGGEAATVPPDSARRGTETVSDFGATVEAVEVRVGSPPTDPYAARFWEGKPVIACYIVDFGTIVKGDVKKKTIRLSNTSSTGVSLVLDKKRLANTGVTISPEKIPKLAGHPNYMEQSVDIQLYTKGEKARDVSFGNYSLTVPLEVRGSGFVTLEVKAFIMVPQLTISHSPIDSVLDFHTTETLSDGSTLRRGTTVGEARIVTLQFSNPLPLPCEWHAKCEMKKSQPRNMFTCKPDKGVLHPKQTCNVEVTFVPFEGGYTQGLLNVKIAHNPRTIQIPCAGTGEDIVVTVDPPQVSLPPVLPFQEAECTFTLKNSSLRPVEVYATAFDKTHLVEAEILRSVKIYGSDGVGYLQPREVGGSLDEALLEQFWGTLESRDGELIKQIAAFEGAVDSEGPSQSAPAEDAVPLPTQSLGGAAAAPSRTPDSLAGPVIVLHGPPLSGKTATSKLLAEHYGCEVLDFDTLLESVADSDTDHGLYVKNLLDPWPGDEGQQPNEAVLASILKAAFAERPAVIIDGLASRTTGSPEVLASVISQACTGQDLRLVMLDIDPQCIDLREARISEQRCTERQAAARIPEISEDDYDAMEPAARRTYERDLKRLRSCKKDTKAAAEHRAKLEQQREALDPEDKVPVLQMLEKEEAARMASEQEEAASKKKQPAKKGAPPVSETPEVPEDDLSPLELFKKRYPGVMKALQPPQVFTVPNRDEVGAEGVVQWLFDEGMIPLPTKVEGIPSSDLGDATKAPVTKLRVEKPKPRKAVRKSQWFTITDQGSRPVTPAPAEAAKSKSPKPPGEVEAVSANPKTRWILRQNEEVTLTLRFCATRALGDSFEDVIEFGVVGSKHTVTLPVRAVCVHPDLNRDPRVAFTTRKAVKKGVYDFGPLLVRERSDGGPPKGGKRQSVAKFDVDGASEVLKIQNLPLFDAEVSWVFAGADQKTFTVTPAVTKLKAGDMEKLRVIAAPDMPGKHETQLVGLIKDNPKPVVFNIQCMGCAPEVELLGCEDTPEGKAIDFGKLLLDVNETRDLTIVNVTSVPLRWELVDPQAPTSKIRPEFSVAVPSVARPDTAADERVISKGKLDPKGASKDRELIQISFQAPKADVIKSDLVINIKDEQDQTTLQSIPVKLAAEAYDLYLCATDDITFGKNGLVKVGMQHKKEITLSNRGKYPFSYEITLRKKFAQYFSVEPAVGVLKPKVDPKDPGTIVEVTFEARNEVCFRDTTRAEFDINICQGTDPGKLGPVVGSKPVFAEVEARSLRFQVMPAHGLNFGPCLSNDKKKMPLDILNNGPFELKYKLYDFSVGHTETSPTPDLDKKGAKKPAKDTKSPAQELDIGAFKISSVEGVVAPGESREVTVILDPKGASSRNFCERLGVFIDECNPYEAPSPLLLEGESCAPGISADLSSPEGESIFEEQQIVTRMEAFQKLRSVFAKDDRVFSFGPIITRQSVKEAFRITNPFTVPCTVNAAVKKRGESEGAASAMSAFQVAWGSPPGSTEPHEGPSITIPPHEHRYVHVTFTPTEMRSYFALFEAVVKDGSDPASKELVFELRGEGSLPQLQVELQPPPPPRVVADAVPADAKGKPKSNTPPPLQKPAPNTLVFYRTVVGKRNIRHITLTNVGDLPAEFKFSLPARERESSPFQFPARNEVHNLPSGASQSYPVYFEPQGSDTFSTKLTMTVTDNSFEDVVITLLGEGCEENVMFSGVDDGCDNFLTLKDCGVGEVAQHCFKLECHADTPIRYSWASQEKFTVHPSLGHILPGQATDITVRFVSPEPDDIDKAKLTLQHWKVRLHRQSATVWDDTMTSVRWEPDITPPPTPKESPTQEAEDAKPEKGKKPKGGRQDKKDTPEVEEVAPEPAASPEELAAQMKAKELERKRRPLKKVVSVTPEPGFDYLDEAAGPAAKDLFVKVVCDHAQWELAAGPDGRSLGESGIRFSTTQLFQTRTVPFVLKNTGKIGFECAWRFTRPDGSAVAEEGTSTFSIDPAFCNVPAGSSQAFQLAYAPLDTENHQVLLRAHIPNVCGEEVPVPGGEAGDTRVVYSQPAISVRGVAECPLVHFALQENDYLSSGRRNPELAGPAGRFLEPATCRVMELACSGVKVRTTRRFFVLNPTNMSYEYEWVDHTVGPDAKKFTCHSQKGVIHSGKRAEMVFDFTPETLDLKEACWEFTVGGRGTEQYFKPFSVPFLLVGRPSEPNVVLEPSRINYDQVLLGAKGKKTIHLSNSESIPFAFSFNNAGRGCVQVSPMGGTIPAHSTLPVEVTFSPTSEEHYNINVVCNVKKRTNPLTCNIKGEGYSIHESLVVRNSDGSTQLLTPGEVNTVDFGRVHVNSKQTKQLIISNSGRLHFDFKWTRTTGSPFLHLSPDLDTVGRNGKSICDLTFSPTRVTAVDGHKMVCKITNGATYTIAVNGCGVQPNIQFSTSKIDFGPQFLYYPGNKLGQLKKQVLTITNMDTSDVSFECNADLPPWLESDVTPTVLAKSGTKEGGAYVDRKDVYLIFKPTESGKVDAILPFDINGMFTVYVSVTGEGTVPKIELASGQTGSVNFGSVRAGELRTVSVKAVCRSKIPTPFSLAQCLPSELAQGSLITVTPTDSIVLKPRETRSVEFKFRPPLGLRMAPFTYNIEAEVAGLRRHFVTLMGCSIGVEVHIDQKTLSFGTVVQGTRQVRRVLIMNTGDVAVAYQWPDLEGTGYSVSHPAGMMAPHSEQACDVVFAPTTPMPQGNRDVNIKIVDQTVHPHTTKLLPLSLVGVCSKRPNEHQADKYTFECPVRESDVKRECIRITNPTQEDWFLSPALDNTSWHVPEKVTIPAGGSEFVPVTYSPQTMTPPGDKEYGVLFIPVPTGDTKQMVHRLEGESTVPGPVQSLEETISAKSTHTMLLEVHNWLPAPQRFSVAKDFMLIQGGTPAPIDSSVTIAGGATIDVPQKATRKFKLTLLSYKECKLKGSVRFLNEATKEYCFYNINFNVGPPKELKVIVMKSPARQTQVEDVFVENPCDTAVSMEVSSTGAAGDLTHADRLSIDARSTGRLQLTYLPLIPSQDKQAKLMLKCPELGDFPYTVNLTSLPSVPEKAARFQAALGQSQQVTLRLKSLAKTPVEYTCKFHDPKSPFFKTQMPMVVKVPASTKPDGEEFSMDVTYEPYKLGEVRDTLEISSPVGGTFEVGLQGTCTMPQRQGPYECKTGQARALPFKNVLNENMTYSFSTDSPAFTLSKPSEVAPPKKDITLTITYKPGNDEPAVQKAKLNISATLEGSSTPVTWVYYLSGVPP